MNAMHVNPIGKIVRSDDGAAVSLDPRRRAALEGLEGFGHVWVLWWFDGCDTPEARSKCAEANPYRAGPARLGTFATRSPERPNPIALSCARVTYIDREKGLVGLGYIDAEDGSPVLDLKPYTPSLDRVEVPAVPGWCAHWPASCESSGDFDWEREFNF